MLYYTAISRRKLKHSLTEPDESYWQSTSQVRETPESYYQPAVELLDIIHKKYRKL